jgi:hypothetical protein
MFFFFLFTQILAQNLTTCHPPTTVTYFISPKTSLTIPLQTYFFFHSNHTRQESSLCGNTTMTMSPSRRNYTYSHEYPSAPLNTTSFVLSDFMASLSAASRIGPRPTNITGIVQSSYSSSLYFLLQNRILQILPLFLAWI